MKIKWLGHASFLVKTKGLNIYIDPYAGEYTEKADLILASHEHGDHCALGKIDEARKADTVIVTSRANATKLTGRGEVLSLEPGESREVRGIKLIGAEAHNTQKFRSPGVPFHPEGIQVAFIIESEGKRIYHAGDTDPLPSMNELGPLDVAMLPIDGHFTMTPAEAIEAATRIKPKLVIPMHWRDQNVEEFKKNLEASGVKVRIPKETEEIEL